MDDEEEERQEHIAIISLFNPTYDSEANTLKFDIIPENATTATTSLTELPTEFGQSTLVIDDTSGIPSHAEGEGTSASGDTSHAEGYGGGGCC